MMDIYLIYDENNLYAWSNDDDDIKIFKKTFDKNRYSVIKKQVSDEEYQNYVVHYDRELIVAEVLVAGFPEKRVALLPIAKDEYANLQYIMTDSYNQAMVEVFYDMPEALLYVLKDEYLEALAGLGMYDAFEDYNSEDSTHDTYSYFTEFNTINFILDHKLLKFKGV